VKHRSPLRFILEGLEGAGALLLVLPTWPLSRLWLKNWGSTAVEREREWPGDALVARRQNTFTRAITVRAPPSVLWSWAVQFGLDRAGFYSYELLERVVGIPVKNVEEIVPEFQSLAVGNEIRLHPKARGIPVALIEKDKHICFGTRPGEVLAADADDPTRSFSIYIESVPNGPSRLLLRGCVEPLRQPSLSKRIGLAFEEPIDFLMEQRMLRTMKRLAESTT